jgi:fumarylacetoacetase
LVLFFKKELLRPFQERLMTNIDATHDPELGSWVADANGHAEFPIQNLPFGVFTPAGSEKRTGVAIGDHILDLQACVAHGLLGDAALRAAGGTLNAMLALGAGPRRALRAAVSGILAKGARAEELAPTLLHEAAKCTMEVPVCVGDYTDFYAGIHHAVAVGKLFRPDAPLLPNYKHVPIGYHGRASSVRASGVPFRRPNGQRKPGDEASPDFGPCRNLDFELELGIWIGPGNAPGVPIPIGQAADHIAGFCLLNDWSARDVQAWEYQPLGPFLAKSFATTVSPWMVTPEALAPFRVAQPDRPEGDPRPLPYLWDAADQREGALNIGLEAYLLTAAMRAAGQAPFRLAHSNTLYAYWTVAQMVAHHSCNGCDLRAGDLFGSGTLSGPTMGECGSLLELTSGGRNPVSLPHGETRRFLEDGDEIILRAHAVASGAVPIGFGECRAVVMGPVV